MSGGRKKAAPRATHEPSAQSAPGIPGSNDPGRSRSKAQIKTTNARVRAAGIQIPSARAIRAGLAALAAVKAVSRPRTGQPRAKPDTDPRP